MLKRWNVHHGNQDLGLMTAKEIRGALRKGTLDPFDKVSAEGSNIREDLIEVDEIFSDSEDEVEGTASQPSIQAVPQQMTADGTSVAALPTAAQAPVQAQVQPQASANPPSAFQNPVPSTMNRPAPSPINFESDDAPRTNPPPNVSYVTPSWKGGGDLTNVSPLKDDSKSTQKRYYLIDKAKILGPVSALEIQSLFNRGGINAKVKVQRIGGTKAIPISQFIASFSEDRIKELTEDGKMNQKISSPSSKVLNELARAANAQKIAKDRKNKTYLILAAAGFIFGAIVLVIFDSSGPGKKTASEQQENEGKKGRPKLLQKPESESRNNSFRDTDNEEKPEPVRVKPKAAAQPKASRPEPVREVREPRRQAPAPARAVTRPAPVESRPAPAKAVQPKVAAAAPKPKAPEPAPVAKVGPIERALSSGGGVQTVGPLSFSMGALDSCASKCTLTLRDSTGMSIKAVFFKSAYYDQLKKSSGSVFISGTVRREGSGASILIQDVR